MFLTLVTSKAIEMLDTELNYIDESEGPEIEYAGAADEPAEEGEEREAAPDAEAVLSQDLATTELLTRDEEADLARAVMRARRRLLRSLRDKRRLTRMALEHSGRGVVTPDADFREREAVVVWKYAQRLARARNPRAVGLDAASLRSWIREFGVALKEYRQLRDKMVRANLRLVSVLARRYRHPTLTYLDLFQEGVLGLLRAVEKYDPERNVRFATYATWWIWQQLGRSVDTYGPLIRTPVHWSQLRRRMQREDERGPSEDEDGGDEGERDSAVAIDPQRLETIVQGFQYVSTDAPMGDEDDRALGALLAADDPAPDELVGGAALRDQLERILEGLPQREQLIVRQRFGLGDDQTRTLEEIGQELGVSRERIRQLEARALNMLKQGCEDRGLRDYLH
jgi:RNA polymerase primary sigma factor